eukprot:1161242-Pelagomonas_calceolata.AAC.2
MDIHLLSAFSTRDPQNGDRQITKIPRGDVDGIPNPAVDPVSVKIEKLCVTVKSHHITLYVPHGCAGIRGYGLAVIASNACAEYMFTLLPWAPNAHCEALVDCPALQTAAYRLVFTTGRVQGDDGQPTFVKYPTGNRTIRRSRPVRLLAFYWTKLAGLHEAITPAPTSFASELQGLLARKTMLENKYASKKVKKNFSRPCQPTSTLPSKMGPGHSRGNGLPAGPQPGILTLLEH